MLKNQKNENEVNIFAKIFNIENANAENISVDFYINNCRMDILKKTIAEE